MGFTWRGPPPGEPIGEPYINITQSGSDYFSFPDIRVFAYDPITGNWSSKVQKLVDRLSGAAHTQSVRNKVGYTLGGNRIPSTTSSYHPDMFSAVDTISTYDFRNNTFSAFRLPEVIGKSTGVQIHCLDRVGDSGVLVAFGGNSYNEAGFSGYVSLFCYHHATRVRANRETSGLWISSRYIT